MHAHPLEYHDLSLCHFHVSDVTISFFAFDGVIDLVEGPAIQRELFVFGFSYGDIPLRVRTFTYDQFRDNGYDLTDDFDPQNIPRAADGKCFQ